MFQNLFIYSTEAKLLSFYKICYIFFKKIMYLWRFKYANVGALGVRERMTDH